MRWPVFEDVLYADKFTEIEHRLCSLIILVHCALVVGAW